MDMQDDNSNEESDQPGTEGTDQGIDSQYETVDHHGNSVEHVPTIKCLLSKGVLENLVKKEVDKLTTKLRNQISSLRRDIEDKNILEEQHISVVESYDRRLERMQEKIDSLESRIENRGKTSTGDLREVLDVQPCFQRSTILPGPEQQQQQHVLPDQLPLPGELSSADVCTTNDLPKSSHPSTVRLPELLSSLPPGSVNFSDKSSVQGSHTVPTSQALGSKQSDVYSNKQKWCINKLKLNAEVMSEISNLDVEVMNKSQFMEFTTYEENRFDICSQSFTAAVDEYYKLDLNDPVCNKIILNMDRGIPAYKERLDAVKKKHFLHLKTGDSLLKKVDLVPFSGNQAGDTIYEFLEVFSELADTTLNPTEKVNLLFNTYLSEKIKSEVQSFKGNYTGMINHLIMKYGDMRVICEQRTKLLESLPHGKNDPPSKAEYYKQVEAALLQLMALTSAPRGDCLEARNTLYNIAFVNTILKSMPDQFVTSFCKNGYEKLSGEKAFNALLKHVQDYSRTNQNIIRIQGQYHHVKQTSNVSADSNCESPLEQGLQKSLELKWVCPVCPDEEPHEFGYCDIP